jgi:hypothetical protein
VNHFVIAGTTFNSNDSAFVCESQGVNRLITADEIFAMTKEIVARRFFYDATASIRTGSFLCSITGSSLPI